MEIQENWRGSEIAVVGMAGRFPGANNVDDFWHNVRDGVEAVTFFTDDQLRAEGVHENMLRNPHYVKAGMTLQDMEMFDAAFFRFSPRDAAIMDPQHRHFLEVSWEALEHAGYAPKRFDGAIGVFGGSGMNAYLPYNLLTNPDLMNSLGLFLVRHTGNDKDFLTTRVSYLFDLRGPSVNVQTACSTSLVAIHLACQSLMNFECDMALAGGVTIEMPHRQGYLYQEDEILSPDGHCRAFDAQSKGTVFGSGVGVVVLRRLEDALNDRDTIHAVIRGSAINNDGSGKMNYFAPSVDGQAAVIAEALAVADVPADSISYVETHGTGTALGDTIEVAALTQAFRVTTDENGFCGIGSVKTNIGHLDTAAGVASFIKVVQALKHRQLPPSLNFEQPNPTIDFASSPFYVNAQLSDWNTSANPRRAGVSSLGVGGTNAHIVLEEAPKPEPSGESRRWQLLNLSAKTQPALDSATRNLSDFLEANTDVHLADVAYTLQVGREEFAHRRIVVCCDGEDACTILRNRDAKRIFSGRAGELQPRIAFMFPGGGAQYPNMGRGLYEAESTYREVVDECLALIEPQLNFNLKSLLYPDSDHVEFASDELEKPLAGLLALFITEYASARLWMSWGIQPAAMTGHSMGEYVAACLAGVMSLKDALAIVALRGRLFESLPSGAMLSIPLAEAEVAPLLVEGVSIAVINSPSTCVVSGDAAGIEAMEQKLTDQGIEFRRVKISVAAHSPMLDPILDEFQRFVAGIPLRQPSIPYISNLTGTWVRPADATDPQYWVNHLRHTVRFSDGIGTLMQDGDYLLLEVGPGNTLGSLAREHPAKPEQQVILQSLRHPRDASDDAQFALTTLGRLWLNGQSIDWSAFYMAEARYRIPLPTYPFEHQRFWIEPGKATFDAAESVQSPLTSFTSLDDWFYKPVWKPAALERGTVQGSQRWLVFVDSLGLGHAFVRALEKAGHEVITVSEDNSYKKSHDHAYRLNPRMREDYFDLVEDLRGNGGLPQQIVHLWAVTPEKLPNSRIEFYEKNRDNLFYSLLFLTQALTQQNLTHSIHLGLVSNGMQQIKDEALMYPEKAILLGPCRVIPHEYPNLTCRSVDVEVPKQSFFNNRRFEALAQQLVAEFTGHSAQDVVAYRDGERWTQQYEKSMPAPARNRLREDGVYLITGGLGGIGLTLAKYLATVWHAKLILIGRSVMPEREAWDRWLESQPASSKISQQIRQIREIEAAGGEVMVASADVSNRRQLQAVIEEARTRFGTIHGVIHAAGTIDDNIIQLKIAGAVERVLAPKIRGVLLLDELLRDVPLDFFMLFSSTSTILGPAGQLDYAAANAFLDAFARYRSGENTYTVSLNWGMWQEVGMAANMALPTDSLHIEEIQAIKPGKHPLLQNYLADTESEIVYASRYDVPRYWILNEHRLKDGTALFPGSSYLEVARAALQRPDQRHVLEIDDLAFVNVLQVDEHEPREVRVALHKNGHGYDLTVQSRSATNAAWLEHAHGKVSYNAEVPPVDVFPLDEIAARCQVQRVSFASGEQFTRQEEHLRFGPRWKVLREVYFGDGEALAMLELPEGFVGDLDDYQLHPALLDLATGFGLPLAADYESSSELYVPFSYGRVRVFSSLPQRIYSYARYQGGQTNTAIFDVTIVDERGCVLVQIEDFMMQRVSNTGLLHTNGRKNDAPVNVVRTEKETGQLTLLDLGLKEGIRPEEGVQVFERVLSSDCAPQTVATSLSLDALLQLIETSVETNSEGQKFSRPSVSSDYAAARDELEKSLVSIWESTLGIEQIGIHDDFFELGGQSLIAIRLLSQIRKTFNVNLPIASFFQAPTIAQSTDLLRAELGDGLQPKPTKRRRRTKAFSSLVPIQPNGSKLPFFCVHGAGGNVMVYSVLSDYLGFDQPFFGLQAQGVDGESKPLDRIEEMAALYIREIRELYPHGPYLLGGFSMGGEVAFEMAQQLVAQGEEVRLLVLFDTLNPARSVRMSRRATETLLDGHRPGRLSLVGRKVLGHIRRLSALSTEQKFAYLRRDLAVRKDRTYLRLAIKIAALRGKTLPFSLVQRQLWETNLKAVTNYVPSVYPGKIVLFRASENLEANPLDDPMGWGPLAADGVDEYIVEGTHNIVEEPYVVAVVRQLKLCLKQAQDQLP